MLVMAREKIRQVPAAAGQQGLTLVELVTTVAVLAVLLGLAAPAFQQLVAAQRMRAASYDLVSDLVLARSEALKRSASVQLLPADSGWAGGWRVQASGGSEPLAQSDGLGTVVVTTAPGSVTFDLNGRVAADGVVRIGLSDGQRKRCISLDPSGRPKSASAECPT